MSCVFKLKPLTGAGVRGPAELALAGWHGSGQEEVLNGTGCRAAHGVPSIAASWPAPATVVHLGLSATDLGLVIAHEKQTCWVAKEQVRKSTALLLQLPSPHRPHPLPWVYGSALCTLGLGPLDPALSLPLDQASGTRATCTHGTSNQAVLGFRSAQVGGQHPDS